MDHNKLSLARLAVNLLYQKSHAHWLKAVNDLWGSAPLPQSVQLRLWTVHLTRNVSALADHCHASRNNDGNNQTLVKGL